LRRSIFDDAFGFIDSANRAGEREMTELKERTKAAETGIETLIH
jgi:hypothetical protein